MHDSDDHARADNRTHTQPNCNGCSHAGADADSHTRPLADGQPDPDGNVDSFAEHLCYAASDAHRLGQRSQP